MFHHTAYDARMSGKILRSSLCRHMFTTFLGNDATTCPPEKPLALIQGCCQYHKRQLIDGHEICDGSLLQLGDPDECCPRKGYLKLTNDTKRPPLQDYPGMNRTSKWIANMLQIA